MTWLHKDELLTESERKQVLILVLKRPLGKFATRHLPQ